VRRIPLPLATVLGAFFLGSVVLIWGLFQMHAGRRRALEQFARKELETRLAAQLAEHKPTIDAGATDPLIAASRVLLIDRGEQILPRSARTGTSSARSLYTMLLDASAVLLERAREDDPDGPWTERLGLLEELRAALVSGERERIEADVRAILSHRGAYVLTVTSDIPFTLALLTLLVERASPAGSLMEALLRTGLSGRSTHLEGVQRALLRHRERFSHEDMTFLAGRVVELCEPHNVLYVDFQTRVAEPPGEIVKLPETLTEPMLLHGGRWYVEPAKSERVYGVTVELDAMLAEITSAMRDRSLLTSNDVVAGDRGAPTVALSALNVTIASPAWQPATDAVESRYRLKAALELVIALLAFGVMGLAAFIYRRRDRFLELKSDFVSAVSHELRTPLASIRLMAETLERRTKDLPKARDYPARIIRDVDGLSFLVENILSFNRLSRGRWTPQKEKLPLTRVLEKIDQERDSWAKKPAELSWSGADDAVLDADPDLIQLLLTNLARNACAYNEREPVVTISAHRDGHAWVVRVSDNGIGIPEDERERIFADFHRGAGGKVRGSGLGLSICRKIMQAHGGTIQVASSSPDGTTFELRFPL
jgi:signal transduction histidine kinase